MSKDNGTKQLIFESYYDTSTKQVGIKIHSKHIPMLAYAKMLVEMYIQNEIIKQETGKSENSIVLPKGGLGNFLKRD